MFEKIKKIVRKRLETGSHDWEHTLRVYNMAMHIGKIVKCDLNVLKYSAILHDICRPEQDKSNGKVCHAEEGGKVASQILTDNGFDDEFVKRVVHCIEAHRFRNTKEPVSTEAKVLYDSDKLDSIGAIGIGRAFLFSGEIGAKLHDKDWGGEEYSTDDTAYREFMVKLRHVKDKMLTSEGKKIAEERREFMVGFFDRLNKEIDGEL